MAFADRIDLDNTPPLLHDLLRQLTPAMPNPLHFLRSHFSSTGVFYIADCQLTVMLEARYIPNFSYFNILNSKKILKSCTLFD